MTFYAGLYFVKADVSDTFKYVIIGIVFIVNAWFLTIWSYMSLTTFKYWWTDKIASWVKRIICRRITPADLAKEDDTDPHVGNTLNGSSMIG